MTACSQPACLVYFLCGTRRQLLLFSRAAAAVKWERQGDGLFKICLQVRTIQMVHGCPVCVWCGVCGMYLLTVHRCIAAC